MATLFRFTDLIGEGWDGISIVHDRVAVALRKLSEPDEHGDYWVSAFIIAHSGNRVYGVFHTPFARVLVGKTGHDRVDGYVLSVPELCSWVKIGDVIDKEPAFVGLFHDCKAFVEGRP